MQGMDSAIASAGVSNHDEDTPLLPGRTRSWLAMRYGNTRKCVSNKAALLILLWSFVVGLFGGILLNPQLYLHLLKSVLYIFLSYGYAVVITLFFPLAGILADIKFGRYKMAITSLFIVSLAVLPTAVILVIASGVKLSLSGVIVVVIWLLGSIPLSIGLIGFTANAVQFGMDQLHDSPAEDNTLFIHWYVWTYYASFFSTQLAFTIGFTLPYNTTFYNNFRIGYYVLVIPVVVVIVLAITLCLVRRRRRWFLIEPGGLNPYKLVYRVTKFARQHKTPVQRSAFTYCEDELPSGLDLGKEKYGGCFTTEQVEDVKAFYGILKVLLSFGIVFSLDFAADSIGSKAFIAFTEHTYNKALNVDYILLKTYLISPLLIVICIPLYLCLLRPFISKYIPGMLKRMGLGMFLVLLSLLTSFTMVTMEQSEAGFNSNNITQCITVFTDDYKVNHPSPLNLALLLIQFTLSALSHMLIYTAVFEFICSQSPHSMKGLLIGVLYAIRGLYQLVAAFLVVPFENALPNHPISCGLWYYLMNIIIGAVALLVYVCVSKRYRYRERDEFCDIHQYAENYYSNQQGRLR